MEGELGRRLGDERLDEAVVEADPPGRPIDAGACPGEDVDRPGAEDLDPDLAEDPERRPVDRLDLVCAQDLDRRERVLDHTPGQPAEPRRRTAAAAMTGVGGHGDLVGRWTDRGREYAERAVTGSTLRRPPRPSGRARRAGRLMIAG